MKIKTVAIIGAGAIGSYFIAGLTEKLGDDLCLRTAKDFPVFIQQPETVHFF